MSINKNNNNNNFNFDVKMENPNLKFNELHPFESNINFLFLLRFLHNILNNYKENEWIKHILLLNYLRRLRKYQKKIYETFIYDLNVFNYLTKFLNSIRTALSKLTLIFFNEIFSKYEFEYKLNNNNNNEKIELINLLNLFVPKIINKYVFDKTFLKEEALKALNNLSENMFYGDSLIILLKCICNDNINYSNISFNVLLNLIKNFEKNYLIYYENWNEIFFLMVKIYEKKKECFIKKPGKIFIEFENKIDNFREKIFDNESFCSKDKKIIINKAIEYYKNKENKNNDKKCKLKNLIIKSKNNSKSSNFNNKEEENKKFQILEE